MLGGGGSVKCIFNQSLICKSTDSHFLPFLLCTVRAVVRMCLFLPHLDHSSEKKVLFTLSNKNKKDLKSKA